MGRHGWTQRVACGRLLQRVTLAAVMALATGCAPVTATYASRSAQADRTVRDRVAQEQALRVSELPSNTIGVFPLSVRAGDSTYASLGHGFAALLASDLAQSRRLRVVERLQLDAVVRELDLVKSGRIDSATAPRAGRIVGARRLIVGDISVAPDGALQIGSRIANTVSGRVDASLDASSPLSQLFDAEKALVFRIFEALGVTISPAERRRLELRPTQSLEAFLAFSRGVQLEANRDFSGAAASFNAALSLDPNFREAGARASTIAGTPPPATISGLTQVSGLTTDLVNRAAPIIIGTGIDTAVGSRQIVRIVVTVRTP